MTQDIFRQHLEAGTTGLLAWSTLGSPFFIEVAGSAGWDAVLIDQQHGSGGHQELASCLLAARAADLPALVRVSAGSTGRIERALDEGAQGVMMPMVNGTDDARALVNAVKYPPIGKRSWGPYRAEFLVEGDYQSSANNWTVSCAQIETKEALDNLDEILGVDGLDMVLVGPNDLCVSLTNGSQRDVRHTLVLEALDLVLAKCRQYGKIAGVFANDVEYARPLIEKGWNIVAVGTESGLLKSALATTMNSLRSP